MAREWVFSTRPRAPGVQGIRNPSATFNQSGQRDSQRPAGAPAGPVTEHSDVTPARSAGLTASSEARKRAKGFEPSTFSLGIAFPQLKTALLHSKR
jgi:hypothetical protein